MKSGFLGLENIRFDLLSSAFPEIAQIRFASQILIDDGDGLIDHSVEVLGPFVFCSSNQGNKFFLLYIPHYALIYVPNSNCIDLIPFNPVLKRTIRLGFKDLGEKNVWRATFRSSCQLCENFTSEFVPIPFQASVFDIKTQTTQDISLIVGNSSITIDYGTMRKKLFNIDTRISTSIEDKSISSSHSIFCFKVWTSQNTDFNILIFNFDFLLTAFLSIEAMIQDIHKVSMQNHRIKRQDASEFPVVERTFRIKGSEFVSASCSKRSFFDSYKGNITFSSVKVPSQSTDSLSLIDFNKPLKRTVLIQSGSQTSNTNHPLLKDLSVELTNENNVTIFKKERENIANSILTSSFILGVFGNSTLFSFAEKNDREFFSREGGELITSIIKPPHVCHMFDDFLKKIGLKLNKTCGLFPGHTLLSRLRDLISKFDMVVNTSSPTFTHIVSIVTSVLFDYKDKAGMIVALSRITEDDERLNKYFLGHNENYQLFVYRLIVTKLVSQFCTKAMGDPFWTLDLYGLISIPDFAIGFLSILRNIEMHDFIGNYQHSYESNIIHKNNYSNKIYNQAYSILRRIRQGCEIEDLTNLVSSILSELIRYLCDGFIPKNQENMSTPWFIFINALSIKVSIPELLVFQKLINNSKTSKENPKILISRILYQGLLSGMLHFWVMFYTLSAQNSKCFSNESQLFSYEELMIVAESLFSLSSVFFNLNEDKVIASIEF